MTLPPLPNTTEIYCAACDAELLVAQVQAQPAGELVDRLFCPRCETAPAPGLLPDWWKLELEWVEPLDPAHPTVRRAA